MIAPEQIVSIGEVITGNSDEAMIVKHLIADNLKMLESACFDEEGKELDEVRTDIGPDASIVSILLDRGIMRLIYSFRNSEPFNEIDKINELLTPSSSVLKKIRKAYKVSAVDSLTKEEFINALESSLQDNQIIIEEDGEFAEAEKAKEAEEEYEENDEEEEDDSEIVAYTERVMKIYEDLYAVGFELEPPYGVITKDDGYIRLDPYSLKPKRPKKGDKPTSWNKLYEIVKESSGNSLVQSQISDKLVASKLRDLKYRSGTIYYPEFQLGNMFGCVGKNRIDSWDELGAMLRKDVSHIMRENYKRGYDLDSLLEALTTSIVIESYDKNSGLKLAINVGNRRFNLATFIKLFNERQATIFAGNGQIYRTEQLQTGVAIVEIMFNEASYLNKPLFAYQAVDIMIKRNKPLDIRHLIIGQTTKGRMLTHNFDSQSSCITLIGAGQRSGKGVLTLNLLGTILADGCPLIYMDGKPDMSVVLREVASKAGTRAAVWDAYSDFGIKTGNGAPSEIVQRFGDVFCMLAYFKVLQLMMVSAHLAVAGKLEFEKRPFFVFDEVLAVQSTLSPKIQSFVTISKDKSAEKNAQSWVTKILRWLETIDGDLGGTVNSQLPASGISTVWLFQTLQQKSWQAQGAKGLNQTINPFMKVIFSRLSLKLMGRGTFDCENGLLKLKDDKDVKSLIENRYFAKSTSQKIGGRQDVEIFKPYLVLNYADDDADCVKEFKAVASANGTLDVVAPNGSLDNRAGFEGFAQSIGEYAMENFSLGIDFLNKIMVATHLNTKYNDIEEYLFDASIDSFYSLAELKNGIDSVGAEGNEDGDSDGPVLKFETGDESKQEGKIEIEPEGEQEGEQELGRESTQENGKSTFDEEQKALQEFMKRGSNEEASSSEPEEIELDLDDVFKSINNDGTEPSPSKNSDNEKMMDTLLNAAQKDYEEGRIKDIRELAKVIVQINDACSIEQKGAGGRVTSIDTKNTKNFSRLDETNSINCTGAYSGPTNWFDKIYMSTDRGCDKYASNLWKSILDTIVHSGMRTVNITRVSVYGEQMYINGKICDLTGVIGGYEDIRLQDIISFKTLFDKFRHIKELRIDCDILNSAIIELGDECIEKMFNMCNKLHTIFIMQEDGSVKTITRQSMNSEYLKKKIQKKKASNDYDIYCRSIDPKSDRKSSTAGDNIWGMKLAKKSASKAAKNLRNKKGPGLVTAALYGSFALTVGVLGSLGWSVVNGVRYVRDK